jgi:hypothetical protein
MPQQRQQEASQAATGTVAVHNDAHLAVKDAQARLCVGRCG